LQPLSFRLLFPNAPEMGALGIRRGNCAILDQFLLHALLQNRGEDFVQRYARRTGGKLNQQIDGRTRFERKGEALEVLQYQLQSHIAEEFQARQELACLVAQKSAESHGATIIGQGEQGGCPLLWRRKKLQYGTGNDAQRAFRAAEEFAQAIAGIVLLHGAQPVPDLAIRQYHFEPEHEVLHHAVTKGMTAAGVGADQSAYAGAAFCAEMQGEDEA